MAEHGTHTVERHADVAVLDGSTRGLAAAVDLARRGLTVIVVDPGDGGATADDREALRRLGGEVLSAAATEVVRRSDGQQRVGLTGGHGITARAVLDAPDLAEGRPELAEPTAGPDATSANEADWDRRYAGDQIWSGNPNGTLVDQIAGLAPGRALDVGAGEGGDAIWLAEQGWQVTASDISGRALDRVASAARARGLDVTCLRVDANATLAFAAEAFDLVSAQYASIPRTPDDRAIGNLLGAVAPGGTLLVVSHDLAPMREPIDTTRHSRAFDPDAYVRVDDVAGALADAPDWSIEVHAKVPRPPGAAHSSAHHVDDLVLRARRRP